MKHLGTLQISFSINYLPRGKLCRKNTSKKLIKVDESSTDQEVTDH